MTALPLAAGFGEAPALAAHGLAVGYRHRRRTRVVLSGLDLRAPRGQLVAVLGRNGSGKSTLLRTLLGAEPPLAGRVEVDGIDVGGMDQRQIACHLSAVLTERPSGSGLRVRELVGLGRHPHLGWAGRLQAADHAVVVDAMAATGADRHADRRVDELSDGERQRVFVARALAQQTATMLLDEPTAFLDVVARTELFALLRQLVDERSLTVVVATHELDEAVRTADILWVVADGGVEVTTPVDGLAPGATLPRVFQLAR